MSHSSQSILGGQSKMPSCSSLMFLSLHLKKVCMCLQTHIDHLSYFEHLFHHCRFSFSFFFPPNLLHLAPRALWLRFGRDIGRDVRGAHGQVCRGAVVERFVDLQLGGKKKGDECSEIRQQEQTHNVIWNRQEFHNQTLCLNLGTKQTNTYTHTNAHVGFELNNRQTHKHTTKRFESSKPKKLTNLVPVRCCQGLWLEQAWDCCCQRLVGSTRDCLVGLVHAESWRV